MSQATQEHEYALGLAGGLTKLFIHSPLSPLLFLSLLFLGIFALMLTPRDAGPPLIPVTFDIPIDVPGAPSHQVATVITPISQALMGLVGVAYPVSTTLSPPRQLSWPVRVASIFLT